MITRLARLLCCSALLVASSCDRTDPVVAREISIAKGHLRYEAETGLLMLELMLADSAMTAPLFQKQAMQAISGTAGRKFSYESNNGLAEKEISIMIEEEETVSFDVPFEPILINSLADTLDSHQIIVLPATDHPITESERVTVVFEPDDGGMPRRMVVPGPTTSGTITLPAPTESRISEGTYKVYLVRQRLIKARQKNIRLTLQTDYFTPRRRVTVS